ncbi:MAG: hypothetical protein IAF38_08685 [Bacteroidia bacterium]|nr:hypothetical protein [Bacteroidia bacterium]
MVKEDSSKVLSEIKASSFDNIIGAFQFIGGIAGIIYVANQMTKNSWGGQLSIIIFLIILAIQGLRSSITLLILKDKLIIRRPLLLTSKTDVSFKTPEIKEVVFSKVKGRFGGPHIIIKSRRDNISYRIAGSDMVLSSFIETLTALNIKVTMDNWVL